MTAPSHRRARIQVAIIAAAMLILTRADWPAPTLPSLSIAVPTVSQAIAAPSSPRIAIAIHIEILP